MSFSAVAKQWAFIVSEFEEAVQAQQDTIKKMKKQSEVVNTYTIGRLNVLELGLAQAKDRRHILRFAFWKTPVTTKNHLLLMFLTELVSQIDKKEMKKTDFRSGMEDALNEWIAKLG